uniref:TadZ_N domain-containing protein n=1 Tax=Steinernema glaseri TaxID=37863 RepID=A0A1I7YG02_9BILA
LTASFLAGGEIPIPVPSTGSDTVTIEYKEFGIRLALSPTVVSRDRITLKVAPEVSELDYNNAVRIAGVTVPGLTVRRTDTSVSLADGESFIISGLISSSARSAVDKFPGLGDVPILGAFFRQSSISREETELLMIVTPRLTFLAITRDDGDLQWLKTALAPLGQVVGAGSGSLDELLALVDVTFANLVFVGLDREQVVSQCALIEGVLEAKPMLAIVALGDGMDNQLVLNAMRAGARDFVAYGSRSSEVAGLVRRLSK